MVQEPGIGLSYWFHIHFHGNKEKGNQLVSFQNNWNMNKSCNCFVSNSGKMKMMKYIPIISLLQLQ